jgi:hypothetical protein
VLAHHADQPIERQPQVERRYVATALGRGQQLRARGAGTIYSSPQAASRVA